MKKTQTILDEIFAYTKAQLELRKQSIPFSVLEKKITKNGIRDFKKALENKNRISLIAEIKKKSPSQGLIRDDFDVKKIAKIYEKAKVDAVSVLTEPKYFGGKLEYLSVVKDNSSIPVFRKDFIFDPYQIYEARVYGADAFLLIASILTKKELLDLMKIGKNLGMQYLVEVHTKDEMNLALEVDADIIGVNNRNLHTFKEDLSTFEKLAPFAPKDKILVAESAIKNVVDVKRVRDAGANAVLVGTSIMKSKDISGKINELKGVKL